LIQKAGQADANWRSLVQLFAIGAMISATTVAMVTVGTALFVAQESPDRLPYAFVILAAVSMLIALGLAGIVDRMQRLRLLQGLLLASAILLPLSHYLAKNETFGATYGIYVAGFAFEILADIVFWTLVVDCAKTSQLPRWTPLLAVAFPIGGALGGALTALLLVHLQPVDLLLVIPLLCTIIVAQLTFLGASRPLVRNTQQTEPTSESVQAETAAAGPTTGVATLVCLLCGNVFLMSVLFHLQEYLVLKLYTAAIADPNALASFIALVNTGIQVLEVILLLSVGRIVLEHAGPLLRNIIFPLATSVSLLALLANFRLPFAVLVNMNNNSVSNAIFEPVKTLNYTAIPDHIAGRVRMVVDGVFYPCGIAVTAILLVFTQDWLTTYQLTLLAFGLAVAFLCIGLLVGRRVSAQLARGAAATSEGAEEIAPLQVA
jgi:hypothetical protein